MAEEKGNLELLHKILEWAKNVLTLYVLNDKFFLAKDIKKNFLAQGSREG